MLRPRIVPCLLVHEGGLVKTVRFNDPTYVGDPINAVRIFNEKEVDELVVLDIDATAKSVEPDFNLIGNLAAECRMPLCYGGGITSVAQAKRIISLGVEKVALSASAVANPALVSEISAEIGRQSTVVVLDVRKRTFGGRYDVYTHNGTIKTGLSALDFAKELEVRGAGEIVFNSIDRDGTTKGYDLDLARQLRAAVNVPISMVGGAGSLEDIEELICEVGVLGAIAGSLFVFKGKYRAVLINYPQPDLKEQLVLRSLKK
ncbi:AglZ/HisF2 family acetamidino modification protein [Altererythrobacter rubellus]|uniref:Imidazole glycerol phosphate synthase subunit HisF n=1 Tax=Altererythrobacter rubellus TaxID=2173831 RepID=A0A9Y2F2K9_9SPHN|nr:AglZ/HisF2 family acetamidino modification protein [Altererythrobacter rubellus]WIW95949.1 AglZ/HisF2 family acetamidino modification protein [Altererythrobacter rubellus]